ncbi:MAG: hypothetical protein GY860_13115 [Desulfobacteraceae bacterium]|nr:hypothetical protein [Desulfobacteraceae bacterium]
MTFSRRRSHLEKVNAMIMADDMDMMALNSVATKISKIAGYVESNFRSLFREYFDKKFKEQYGPRYHQIMEHFDKVDGLLSHNTFFERIEDRIDVDITRRKPSIVEFGFELRCLMGQLSSTHRAIGELLGMLNRN